MVSLDTVRLENVGINGALSEELNALELVCFLSENIYKYLADDLALCLGLRNSGESIEEAVGRINVNEVGIELLAEDLYDLLGLTLAEETVVNMNTGELLADSLDQQSCNNGRIHTAGQSKKDLLVSDLLAQSRKLLGNESLCELGSGYTLHIIGAFVAIHIITSTFNKITVLL